MKTKGFVYTSFAVLAISILLSLLFVTSGLTNHYGEENLELVKEQTAMMETTKADYSRFHRHSLNYTIGHVSQQVIEDNLEIEDSQEIVDIMIGTEDLEGMDNYTIQEWSRELNNSLKPSSRLNLNVKSKELEINNEESFKIYSAHETAIIIRNPALKTIKRANISQSVETSAHNVQDPLIFELHGEEHSRFLERCRFDSPSHLAHEVENYSGSAHGRIITTLDQSQDPGEEVLTRDNLTDINPSDAQEFHGVVSAANIENPEDYNDNYAVGALNDDEINFTEKNFTLIKEGEVRFTGFKQMLEGCYLGTDQAEAPNTLQRIELNTDTGDPGLVTLVDDEQDNSNIGFTSEEGSELIEISETFENFQIHDEFIEEWGLQDLVED